jgi:CheY-like chemotaxis protein
MDNTIRVLLADDHPLVRAGIRATLVAEGDFALVGEASSGDEAQRMCAEFKPDVLLLDVHMPGSPAVQTASFVREQCPDTRIASPMCSSPPSTTPASMPRCPSFSAHSRSRLSSMRRLHNRVSRATLAVGCARVYLDQHTPT